MKMRRRGKSVCNLKTFLLFTLPFKMNSSCCKSILPHLLEISFPRQYQSLLQQLNNSKDALDENILNTTIQTTVKKLQQKVVESWDCSLRTKEEQLIQLQDYQNYVKKRLQSRTPKSPVIDKKHLKAVKLLHNFQDMSTSNV